MNPASDVSVLESNELSSLSTLDAFSPNNPKSKKKNLKKSKISSSKMAQWVNQLKQMPDVREEQIACVNGELLENPTLVIKKTVKRLSEDLI